MSDHTPRPFNPNSTDAMFSKIMEKLERIESQTEKTNGRVSSLEHWRTTVKAKLGLISAGVSALVAIGAWLLERLR